MLKLLILPALAAMLLAAPTTSALAYAPNVTLDCNGSTMLLTLQTNGIVRVNYKGVAVLVAKAGFNVYTSGPKYKLTKVPGGWNWKAPGVNVTCH